MIGMYTKIGVMDSGIGGVTVLRECIKLVPNFEYLYYSDSFHNPYGEKSIEEVKKIAKNIVDKLIYNGCKIIIIACNTASAIAVDYLRISYPNIQFVAIEPAVKLVYDCSQENTLIMATKGTMDSDRFKSLYDKYHHENFYLFSCVGLANLIENDDYEGICKYLKLNLSFYSGKVSNVVLGCTHYPLIKREISEVLGDVTFYDGSYGVAKQLKRIIEFYGYLGNNSRVLFIDSTGDVEKEKRFYRILGSDRYE